MQRKLYSTTAYVILLSGAQYMYAFKIMFFFIYIQLSLLVGCFKSLNAIQCVIYESGQ